MRGHRYSYRSLFGCSGLQVHKRMQNLLTGHRQTGLKAVPRKSFCLRKNPTGWAMESGKDSVLSLAKINDFTQLFANEHVFV